MKHTRAHIDFNNLFVNLLTLIFITLKLLKVIKWSWLWVLSPLWISYGILLLIIIIFVIIHREDD